MQPRAEELWSYLQGLGPVGEPVAFKWREIEADLGMSRVASCGHLKKLIQEDAVRRVGVCLVEVMKRVGPAQSQQWQSRPRLVSYSGRDAA